MDKWFNNRCLLSLSQCMFLHLGKSIVGLNGGIAFCS